MINVDHKTWVLIADGEKALFVENAGHRNKPDFRVRAIEVHENPPARDQAADRPGRLGDSGGPHRSAVEETDWHLIEKERFAKDLAGILYKMVHAKRFEKLVIVAPPQVLGALRKDMHKEVQAVLQAEVPKTLTNQPMDRIERLLS
ncbi:host attachment family protein [Consotaella aegiceratis]|uniref:host attachment family protein n=1 Tax=Consotaella aegiceratis TaxID=3097961 RepID=UPI002F3F56CB